MNDLESRAVEAAGKYLAKRGYEVLDEDWGGPEKDIHIDLVARDGDDIIFVEVSVRARGDALPEETADRGRLEAVAARWLSSHPGLEDVRIRFDAISMLVLGEDRALIRHHINVLGTGELV